MFTFKEHFLGTLLWPLIYCYGPGKACSLPELERALECFSYFTSQGMVPKGDW